MKYRVIAIHTRDGIVERREVTETNDLVDAFTVFGRLCATTNGVLLIDEQQNVYASYEPKQLELVTSFEVSRFQLYRDEGFDREQVRERQRDADTWRNEGKQ